VNQLAAELRTVGGMGVENHDAPAAVRKGSRRQRAGESGADDGYVKGLGCHNTLRPQHHTYLNRGGAPVSPFGHSPEGNGLCVLTVALRR
jgi:hypothetical protein